MVAGTGYFNEKTKLEPLCSSWPLMIPYPVAHSTPLVLITIGAIAVSVILGLVLRSYTGRVSESSILARLSLLIVLAIAVGTTVFIWFIMPAAMVLGGVVSLIIGTPLLFCQRPKKSNG